MKQYNNGLGWFDGSRKEARLERKATEAEAEQTKANALLALANKPAKKTNPALIIIPVAVLLVGGIVAVTMLKKKK